MKNREYLEMLKICNVIPNIDIDGVLPRLDKYNVEIRDLMEFLRKDKTIKPDNIMSFILFLIKNVNNQREYLECASKIKDMIKNCKVEAVIRGDERIPLNMGHHIIEEARWKLTKLHYFDLVTETKLLKLVDPCIYKRFKLGENIYKIFPEYAERLHCINFSIIKPDKYSYGSVVMTLIISNEMVHYRAGRCTHEELIDVLYNSDYDMALVANYSQVLEDLHRKIRGI